VHTQGRNTGSARVLRQLSSRQPQLRDRGSTGNGGANEPGNRGSTRHAYTFCRMARTSTRIGGGRHDLRERGVSAVASGTRHHIRTRDSVHRKKSPSTAPSVSPMFPKATAIVVRQGSHSTMGAQPEEPNLCLHWNPQALWCVLTESAVYQRGIPISCHPHARGSSAEHQATGPLP
jgi:hypothetical protein